jgi:hypothetical protein
MSASMNIFHGDRSRGRLWAEIMGAGEVVATGAGAGAPGAVTSLAAGAAAGVITAPGAEGEVVAPGAAVAAESAGVGVAACGSEAAGPGSGAGGVDVALGGGLAGGNGAGVVAAGLAGSLAEEGVVGAGGVFSCAVATAKPPSVNTNAIPASLEAFKYCERREAMAPKSVPMLESSKPHR